MAHRPKFTRSGTFDRSVPPCPHCGADMDAATITLEVLIDGVPLGARVDVDAEGYAIADGRASVDCPSCARPSVLMISGRDEVTLYAARTSADRSYLARGAA